MYVIIRTNTALPLISAAMKPRMFSCRIRTVWYISVSRNHDASSVVKNTFTATSSPLHVAFQTSPYRPFPIIFWNWICLAIVLWTSKGNPDPEPELCSINWDNVPFPVPHSIEFTPPPISPTSPFEVRWYCDLLWSSCFFNLKAYYGYYISLYSINHHFHLYD